MNTMRLRSGELVTFYVVTALAAGAMFALAGDVTFVMAILVGVVAGTVGLLFAKIATTLFRRRAGRTDSHHQIRSIDRHPDE